MPDRIDDIFSEPHSYRRFLPHIQPINAYYSVTSRLNQSLPRSVLIDLQTEKEEFIRKLKNTQDPVERIRLTYNFERYYYKKYDHALDKVLTGPVWLKNENIAQIVAQAMQYRHGKKFELIAYTIMSNHIHIIFWLSEDHVNSGSKGDHEYMNSKYVVSDIMESLKKFTARQSNAILNRSGKFWARESFDRVLRNQVELKRAVRYVLNNPVKAGLVEEPTDWKWSYCKEDFRL